MVTPAKDNNDRVHRGFMCVLLRVRRSVDHSTISSVVELIGPEHVLQRYLETHKPFEGEKWEMDYGPVLWWSESKYQLQEDYVKMREHFLGKPE